MSFGLGVHSFAPRYFQNDFKIKLNVLNTAYKDLKNAKGTDFASFRVGEGVVHKGRKYIFYSDINYGLTEDNPIRIKGSSGTKVNQISDSRRQGIDPNAELPCVSLSDDPSKTYDGENGMIDIILVGGVSPYDISWTKDGVEFEYI